MATRCQDHQPSSSSDSSMQKLFRSCGSRWALDFKSSTSTVSPGSGHGGTLEIKLIFYGGVFIGMRSPEEGSFYVFYTQHDPIHGKVFRFDPLLHFSSFSDSHEAIAAIIQTNLILKEDHHLILTSEIADFAYKLVERTRIDGHNAMKILVKITYVNKRLSDEIESIVELYSRFKAAASLGGDDRIIRGTCLYQVNVLSGNMIDTALLQQQTASKCKYGGDPKSYGTCAVCLDEIGLEWMQAVELRCMHKFHVKCVQLWLQQKNSCPLCRSNFSTLSFAMQRYQ